MPDYEWILIRQFPLEKDLMPLLKHLTVLGIACHVTEADNQQRLFIRDHEKIDEVNSLTQDWLSGHLVVHETNQDFIKPKIKNQ